MIGTMYSKNLKSIFLESNLPVDTRSAVLLKVNFLFLDLDQDGKYISKNLCQIIENESPYPW